MTAGAAALAFGVRRLLAGRPGRDDARATSFLLLWLGLEVAGYFALTPFPAVRRVLEEMARAWGVHAAAA